MNFQILSQVIEELSALLTGARVERVIQGQEGGVYLLLRRDRKNYALLLSPDRALPRMHLVSSKPQSVAPPHPVVLALRSRLTGSRVATISLLNEDRIARMCFATTAGEQCLVYELTGMSANLILIGPDSRILTVYYPSASAEPPARTLLPGSLYVLPHKKVALSADRNRVEISDTDSPNKAAEAFYVHSAQERSLAEFRSEVRSCIRKALEKAGRKRDALMSDLQTAEQADQYKQAGDLILANLRLLHGGMDRAELTGYDGLTFVIDLDRKLTPSKNAERYFKKFKKAKAGQQIILTRLHDTAEEIDFLSSLRDEGEEADDMQHLKAIRSELSARGYLKEKTEATRKVRPPKDASGAKTVVFRGWEILIGTNASGNDHISTTIARPDDFWLHAEGLPGSHVLVRNPLKKELPTDVLVKAAALAAYYSKGRNADKVAVTYTFARFVKKPKGARPGLVTIAERKTIMVRPSDSMPGQ
jgi:predicted ribosome quality control (RQC) complex YloA/Tae2 family protein